MKVLKHPQRRGGDEKTNRDTDSGQNLVQFIHRPGNGSKGSVGNGGSSLACDSACRVDLEGDDIAEISIGSEEKLALGIDAEVTRGFSLSRLMAHNAVGRPAKDAPQPVLSWV